MSLTRYTLKTKAESYVQDDATRITHTDPGDFGTAIDRALERYSQDKPRRIYATASGDGSTYEFSVPTGWVEDVSELLEVHYPDPPATGQREPNVIFDASAPNEPATVRPLKNASGVTKLRFMEDTPVSGTNNVRFVFTGLHSVHATDATLTTVYGSDEEALAMLAASVACEMVASKYAETKDAALGVDSVDFRSKSTEYAARARQLLKGYQTHMGIGLDEPPRAASGTADWDQAMIHGGDRLIHRRRLL